MSQAGLQKVLDAIKAENSKDFRPILDKNTHVITLDENQIKEQLTLAIKYDPTVANQITPDILSKAASVFYKSVSTGLAKYKRPRLGKDEYVVEATGSNVPFNLIRQAIQRASAATITYIEEALGTGKSKLSTSNLIQFDHRRTVADTRIANIFSNVQAAAVRQRKPLPDLLELGKAKGAISDENFDILTEIRSYYTNDGKKTFLIDSRIRGDLESGLENEARGLSDTNTRIRRLKASIQTALIKRGNFADQPGSDSKLEQVKKTLITTALKSIKNGKNVKFTPSIKNTKIDKTPSVVRDVNTIKQKKTVTRVGVTKVNLPTTSEVMQKNTSESYISLIALFNARLPPVVRANMTGERLHTKSGKFSDSVRVTNIAQTAQGYPTIEYTYQRSPYDVFDPTLGRSPWNTPGRDPKKLIDASIRQIATTMALGRFYTRRA